MTMRRIRIRRPLKARWSRRFPSVRRLHRDDLDPALWRGPIFLPRDEEAIRARLCCGYRPHPLERPMGPAVRIWGRWFGAERASHILFCTKAVKSPRCKRSFQLSQLQWRIAERAGLYRSTSCPF